MLGENHIFEKNRIFEKEKRIRVFQMIFRTKHVKFVLLSRSATGELHW